MIGTKEEGMLYWLYITADGNVSTEERTLFNHICKEIQIEKDTRKEIIKECKDLVESADNMLNIVIDEDLLDSSNIPEHLHLGVVWNLINIGYADKVFSPEEKEILEYVVDEWKIESSLVDELIDIAETMLALIKQKDWLTDNVSASEERNRKLKTLDENISVVAKEAELLVGDQRYLALRALYE